MIRAFGGIVPVLGRGVYVDEQAAVIGDVRLGDDASVWPFAAIRGDVHRIRIGARTNVQDNAVLHVVHDGPYSPGGAALTIGDDVTIGHGAILHACTLGSRILVGMGCIVLDEAEIGDDVFLAAGTLVPPGKKLESGWLYRRSPAQPARKLTAEQIAQLKYSAENYVKLKERYRQG